jgi:trk system potassium uptake protein
VKKRQVAVIGLGRFGSATASALYEQGHEVLAIDKDEAKLDALVGHATHVAQAVGYDRAAMEELGVRNVDVAIVAMSGNLEASILTTLTVKDLGVPYVIGRAGTSVHAAILNKIGADRVVFAEQETAITLAHTFAIRNAQDYMSLGPDYGVAKVAPPDSFIGRSVVELELRERFEVSLIGLCRQNSIVLHPKLDERVRPGDLLVIAGRDDRLELLGA